MKSTLFTPDKDIVLVPPKLLVFDGLDRVGKTTTIKKLWKKRGYVDPCIDRGIMSNIVYNTYFNRDIDPKEYLKFMPDDPSIVYIYMHADSEIIKKRALETKDDLYHTVELEAQQKLFNEAFEWLKTQYKNIKFVSIDTGKHSQDEVINILMQEIK